MEIPGLAISGLCIRQGRSQLYALPVTMFFHDSEEPFRTVFEYCSACVSCVGLHLSKQQNCWEALNVHFAKVQSCFGFPFVKGLLMVVSNGGSSFVRRANFPTPS